MAEFLSRLLGEAIRNAPVIVQAGLAFLACVFMAVCGYLLGEENRWVASGVFAAGALIALAVMIWRWRSASRWD